MLLFHEGDEQGEKVNEPPVFLPPSYSTLQELNHSLIALYDIFKRWALLRAPSGRLSPPHL